MQQQTEGERYISNRMDLLLKKTYMFLTNVDMDTVPDKPNICTSVSVPSNAYMYSFSSVSFLFSSYFLRCLHDWRMLQRSAAYFNQLIPHSWEGLLLPCALVPDLSF